MSTFTQQQSTQDKAPSYSEKQFLHTQTAAVIVPLMQSGVTSLIVFVVAMVLSIKLQARDLISIPLILFVVSFLFTWLWLQRRWLTLTNLEKVIGVDLNNDKVVGPPVRSITVVRIERVDKGQYQSRDVPLSASPAQLKELAQGFANDRPFSEREWTGAGKPFSTQSFRDLREQMLKGLLIERVSVKDPRQGFRLTEEGEKWRDKALTSPTQD